ncbi:hypothetical protein FACS189449_13200 [Alphaproteobacteria bacterium]|nr:hypothetical protein FACS189449_13200 [Alphaproteobacteria bacterium]
MEYNDGYRYDGDWVAGKRKGSGELTWQNGSYVGGWHEDKKHGEGIKIQNKGAPDEEKFVGEFRNGNRRIGYIVKRIPGNNAGKKGSQSVEYDENGLQKGKLGSYKRYTGEVFPHN